MLNGGKIQNPIQTFLSVFNLIAEESARNPIKINKLTIKSFDPNVARLVSSEYSRLHPPGWADGRQFARGFEKYPDIFCNIISRLKSSGSFKSIQCFELRNTRRENKMGKDLLDSILNYVTVLQMLDMTNYLLVFHHLMETQSERFDWILLSGINIVTHLKLDRHYTECGSRMWIPTKR